MTGAREVAERFYRAMATDDGQTLAGLIHPEFTGRVSSGLPLGLGGDVPGSQEMLQIWMTVYKAFDMKPQAEEIVEVGEDRVVAFGFYRGEARETGRKVEAAFSHDVTVRDGQIVRLVQITDTHPWHEALED